jgi:hypothetical protein
LTGHTHDERKDCPDERMIPAAGASANRISIRVDASALSIIALMLSVAAIVIVIAQTFTQPQVVDAKIAAGSAQAQSAIASRVAQAESTAHTAETHARVALDKVEDFRAKLAEKGIKVNLDGH